MTALLPLFAGILLIFHFQRWEKDWRVSLLSAAVVWGVFLTLSTEFLNLFHAINFDSLVAIWLGFTACLMILFLGRSKTCDRSPISPDSNFWDRWDRFDYLLLLSSGLIVLIIGITAIVAPPNNWDSLSYVMPRVMHWMQNHSINHYPAHYTSQLYNGPWADFALMHLQILSGGDRWANLLQWLSMIGCLIGVSLITKSLGGGWKEQIFAVLLCATIPVGILHASNSKNTYVITFWLICLTHYSLVMLRHKPNWHLTFFASMSLGLAILTKGTAYIYALPLLIWLIFSAAQQLGFQIFRYVIGAGAILLTINLGHYIRNFLIFHSPTSTYPYNWNNEIYSFPVFIANILRNISLHLVPPFFNRDGADALVSQIHHFLGVNPVDPRLNLFLGGYYPTAFTTEGVQTFEDIAGNSFHFWLIILAIGLFLGSKKLRSKPELTLYFLSVIGSFFLFCLLIKWQIWHSRLHLPIFVLLCPWLGTVLVRTLPSRMAHYLLIFLLVMALPYLFLNETRPIATPANIFNTDRTTQYFAARPPLQEDYTRLGQFINQRNCREIGLIQRPDTWEYPLWVLLKSQNSPALRIENVNVTNPSQILAQKPYYRNFHPCIVVAFGLPTTQQVTVNQQVYREEPWQNRQLIEPIQVFLKP